VPIQIRFLDNTYRTVAIDSQTSAADVLMKILKHKKLTNLNCFSLYDVSLHSNGMCVCYVCVCMYIYIYVCVCVYADE